MARKKYYPISKAAVNTIVANAETCSVCQSIVKWYSRTEYPFSMRTQLYTGGLHHTVKDHLVNVNKYHA